MSSGPGNANVGSASGKADLACLSFNELRVRGGLAAGVSGADAAGIGSLKY